MPDFPESPRDAFERIRALAARLDAPASRGAALDELRVLAEQARGRPEGAPLRLASVEVAVGARREHLELLLLPSIFAPEEWGFTFLEGLLRVPADEWAGKSLVEVGTGSGWICLALAKLTGLARLAGVDLNPQAAALARCNAWLNGDEALVARLSFAESDLLGALPASARWDFVIGCIPQVLRAEGFGAPADALDPQALLDLSNYCATQDVYEDHFGLGLNARLLDEVPERLAPGGRVILNLAGRPGRGIIERMFGRRGFGTRVLFARRVKQAADTDIGPLVELERRGARPGQRLDFEFFLEPHAPEPLRAETAHGWLSAGHPIWHEVAVWEARLRLPRETLALRSHARALGVERILDGIDLSGVGQEQLDFVASLAARLSDGARLPYPHEAGDARLREQVARWLERSFDLSLPPSAIFVAPERVQAVYSLLLATCDEGDQVLVSRDLHDDFAPAFDKAGVRPVIVNRTLREVKRLLGAFAPRVLFLSVAEAERTNLGALRDILDEASRRGILVVVDESEHLHLSTGVEPRTLLEFLAREPRPSLVAMCGLVKNAVYPDFELTLLLPVPGRLKDDLEIAAEVTYSRVGVLPSWFSARLLVDVLATRVSSSAPAPPPRPAAADGTLPRSRRIASLEAAPAFAPKVFREDDPRLVRLDYGENEDPIGTVLVEGLLAAAASPHGAAAPPLAEAIAAFLLETRGVRWAPNELAVAQGVWPLVHDLGVALRRRLGRAPRVAVLAPCYGVLPPTLAAAGCAVEALPLAVLLERRGRDAPDAVVISQPQNPLGTYLPREELVALATLVVEERALLVSDEIFGLLHLGNPAEEAVASPASLEPAVPGIAARTVLLGGLSKELAAGGLRLGFLAARDAALLDGLRRVSLGRVHEVAARTAAHLYAAFQRSAGGKLLHEARHREVRAQLLGERRSLAARRALLAAAFPPDPSQEGREPGGLFLAPRVGAWLGKRHEGTLLTPANLPRTLYEATGVVVNGGPWCGDPDRVRAVFSIPEPSVREAADRLRAFAAALEA